MPRVTVGEIPNKCSAKQHQAHYSISQELKHVALVSGFPSASDVRLLHNFGLWLASGPSFASKHIRVYRGKRQRILVILSLGRGLVQHLSHLSKTVAVAGRFTPSPVMSIDESDESDESESEASPEASPTTSTSAMLDNNGFPIV